MTRYILMLEHDVHDRELTENYFKAIEEETEVKFLTYSHEVIPYLNKATHLPAIILVRINALPDTGLEVLRMIKGNDLYKHIPVVVLGENTTRDWARRCYAAGANSVINKPSSMHLTDMKIGIFIKYWFHVAELADHNATDTSTALNRNYIN